MPMSQAMGALLGFLALVWPVASAFLRLPFPERGPDPDKDRAGRGEVGCLRGNPESRGASMDMRGGLGPVFAIEWMTTSRRWQTYVRRSLFVIALAAGPAAAGWGKGLGRSHETARGRGEFGASCYLAIVGTQLAQALFVAPVMTAGAFGSPRARALLDHLLTTDLAAAEIVLGRLAARLGQILELIACGLPVMILIERLGGVDPGAMAGALLVTLGVAAVGCALAMALSLRATKAHEVRMAVYAAWGMVLLARPLWSSFASFSPRGRLLGPPPDWLRKVNPLWLCFGPYVEPRSVCLGDDVAFFVGALAVSAALAARTTWQLRSVARRRTDGSARPGRRRAWPIGLSWPGPSLDANPVLWREWHRNRASGLGRALGWLYALPAVGATLLATAIALRVPTTGGSVGLLTVLVIAMIQPSVGLLLLASSAASTLAEERARGSLDVLLSTPIPTRSIVWGKWASAARLALPMALPPTLVAAALASRTGNWDGVAVLFALMIAYGAALSSLGLLLATTTERTSQAVGLSALLYVVVAIGWPFVAFHLDPASHPLDNGLASASPVLGVSSLIFWIARDRSHPWGPFLAWRSSWIVAYATLAAILYVATLVTFDRNLGRITGRARKPKEYLKSTMRFCSFLYF